MTIPANHPKAAHDAAPAYANAGMVLVNGATLVVLVALSLVVFILGHGAGVT